MSAAPTAHCSPPTAATPSPAAATTRSSCAGAIYSVAFAPDGTVLTGGVDRTIRRWPPRGPDGALLFAGAPDN
jgi:hypothetical protein